MWFVYLLHAQGVVIPAKGKPGSRDTYVGITNDLDHRLYMHNSGQVKATCGRQWYMVAVVAVSDRETASLLERYLKCGDSREKRQRLVFSVDTGKMVPFLVRDELLAAARRWSARRSMFHVS